MKRWLIILFVITLTLTLYEISESFGLFESEKDFIVNSDIGRWDIYVNDDSINEITEFSVSNIHVSGDNNVKADYFAPGTTGYFDIVIDPDETEVSVEYSINVSFVKESSLLSSYIEFESYSLNNGSKIDLNGSTAINGEINLNGKSCLDSSDVKTYRIYWRWIGDDLVNNPDESSINANVQVKQKI